MATVKSSYFEIQGSRTEYSVRINWSQTYDASTNTSVVTIDSIEAKSELYYGHQFYPDVLIKVNGVTLITMNCKTGTHKWIPKTVGEWYPIEGSGSNVTTGSTTVVHDADGTKSVTIELAKNTQKDYAFWFWSSTSSYHWGCNGSKTVELATIPTYTLSLNAGEGGVIDVIRTSSGYSGATIGSISNGARLYYNDNLKVTFSVEENYRILSTTVNGESFSSGNTHLVESDVSVVVATQVLASSVGATDANIGSTTTITVTKYDANYCHSLQYEFNGLSGFITSSGGIQAEEVKFTQANVAFVIPESFYEKIPNSKSGICTITCRTYSSLSSNTILGSPTTCTFTATADQSKSAPISGINLVDMNPVTIALSGTSSVLIRYRSTAKCTVIASPRNHASITSITINGKRTEFPTTNGSGVSRSVTLQFTNVEYTSFVYAVEDSRGYITSGTARTMICAYVPLTCNVKISRPSPTGNIMTIQGGGNFFRGSFGAYSNTLRLQYRYKETDSTYCDWKTINSSNILIGAYNYQTNGALQLEGEFDYRKTYIFEVRAIDGVEGYELTTILKTISTQKGIPVFDWSEDDFNVNADLRMSNISILNIIYPVGSVFMSTQNSIPDSLSVGGMLWESLPNVGDIYCWKRV